MLLLWKIKEAQGHVLLLQTGRRKTDLLVMRVMLPAIHLLPYLLLTHSHLMCGSGNNNYLATTARADSPSYGIDYPTGQPMGRFSNGLNIPDLISEEIGSEPTLPYLSPELNGDKLLVGANFASAGIGVLNDIGIQFANILRMHGR